MRTPQEAFDSMCECHGEIWTLAEDGPVRTTKSRGGNKVRERLPMPLEVYDVIQATGLGHVYRDWLLGHIEVLVPPSTKNKLEQERTLAQLVDEEVRAKEESEKIRVELGRMKGHLKSTITVVVEGSSEDELFDSVARVIEGSSEDELFNLVLRHTPKGGYSVN